MKSQLKEDTFETLSKNKCQQLRKATLDFNKNLLVDSR